MQNQSRLFALLLSMTAHIGLGFALGSGTKTTGDEALLQGQKSVIVARLASRDSATKAEVSVVADSAKTEITPNGTASEAGSHSEPASETAADLSTASHIVEADPQEESPLLPVLAQTESHYFTSSELTEPPVLLQDIAPQEAEPLPDVSPPPARVRLLINEKGDVDDVLIEEAPLSEQAKRFITAAFAGVKFSPGKVGGRAVKSQLNIEIALEQVVTPILRSVAVR